MKKPINILLVFAAIAALVVTAIELTRWSASTKASKDALAAVLEKNAALRARIAALNPAAPASPQIDSTKTPAKSAADKKPLGEQIMQALQQGNTEAKAYSVALDQHKANDREFALKYYTSLRSAVDVQYGPFYRLQHLTKEQAGALAEAIFQKQLRYEKADADRRAGGSAANAKAAKASADAELAAAAIETLGADSYGQFALYESQRQAWDYVGIFGGMLSLVDMPLNMEQAARLVDAIANANAAFQRGEPAEIWGGTDTDWDAVDAAAVEFLTPGQLNFLRNVDVGGHGGALGFTASRQTQEWSSSLLRSK